MKTKGLKKGLKKVSKKQVHKKVSKKVSKKKVLKKVSKKQIQKKQVSKKQVSKKKVLKQVQKKKIQKKVSKKVIKKVSKKVLKKAPIRLVDEPTLIKKPSFRSFSPVLNKDLQIHSLKTLKPKSLKLSDDLLTLNIDENTTKGYNDIKVQEILLHNLRASKHLDVTKFIPPIQMLSNCWFNTMFVTFFFSDKGRKFFRFFRELMITGKKADKTYIPTTLAKLFFILNLFIEASYNQTSKSGALLEKINSLTNKLNTNFFIYHIHQIINNKANSINPVLLLKNDNKLYDIPNIEDAGNPITYYESILSYLNYDTLKLLKHDITTKINVPQVIQSKFLTTSVNVIPDILIFEDFESTSLFEKSYTFVDTKKQSYNYVLDAIIITNKEHFDPKANSHFVSVLTVNKKEYKFDGSSLSKLTPFNWKNMINSDKDWNFKEDPKYQPELYNFTKGYKIMFYYRN